MKGYHSPIRKNYTLKKQVIICTALLIALSFLKISPDDVFVKTKLAVNLILNKNTDIKKEAKKIKDFFTSDESVSAMNPVSEFVTPSKNCVIIKPFGVQDASSDTFNYGVDLKIESNENICAAASGEVFEIATSSEYGSYIIIKHNDEISTLYAHLEEILPDVGSTVEVGQAIARSNKENNTIHFEIKKGDTYLNPEEFIDFKNGDKND